jgi:hypothetical protein
LQDVLNGDFHLRGISATGVEIDYCQGVPHNSETIPDPLSGRGAQPSIAIDQLRIRDIRPGCSKQENLLGFLPRQLELEASAPLDGPTSVSLDGIIGDDEVVHLMLSGGSLTELLKNSEAFPFELNLQVPDSGISAAGTVSTPLTDPEVEFRGELVSGHLKRMTGENSMELSAVARGFTSRPYVQVEASLQQLDLRRLLDGAEKPGEKKDPFSFRPVYEFLGRFDARVNIGVGSFLNTPLAVDELAMDASLEGGVLELTRAEFLLAGSPVSAVALLDTRGACAGLSGTVRILNFDLDQLNRFLDDGASLGGRVDQADISSSSCGDTLAEHAGSARVTIAGNGLAGSWGNERLPLSFRSVQLETSWKEAGSLSFDGELLGENLSATAVFGSIESIQSENRSPLKIDARGDASQLTLAGEAGIVKGNLDLDLDVNFDTSRFGSLHAWIGADPGNVLAMRGRTSLALGEDGLSLNDLDLTLGNSDLRGSMSWPGPDSGLAMALEFQSNRLDINELSALFPKDPEPRKTDHLPSAELLTQSEWLEEWLELPPIGMDLSARRVSGMKFDLTEAALQASLSNRHISDGRLNLLLEGIAIEGRLDADLRNRPWTVEYEAVFDSIDIGRVLASFDLAENVDAQAKRASIHFSSKGDTLKQLAENSRLESQVESLHWTFQAGAENQLHELDLSTLEFSTAPESASSWRASGYFNGVPLNVWMRTPPLVSTFDPAVQLPVTLALGTGDDVTMIDAVIDRQNPAGRKVDISVSGEFSNPYLDLSRLEPPLKDYHFRSDVIIRPDELFFSQLQAQIGTSIARGNINIRFEEPNYVFDIDIDSPFLETEDLVHWAEEWRNASHLISAQATTDVNTEAAEVGILTLADQTIDDLTDNNEFNVSIGIEELRSLGRLLGDARLNFKLNENETLIDQLQITSPAGYAEATYHSVAVDTGYEYSLNIDIEGLEYGGLLRLFDPDSVAHGRLFLETSLISRSPGVGQSVNHLQGTVDLVVFPEDIMAGFLDLWASNLILALLPTGKGSGKKLNCMVARFDVENGVMSSRNAFLDSTEIIVRARGDIDLVNRELDLMIAPQSKLEKFLSVSTPIAVKGPFSDFSVGVAPGGFLTTMFRWYYGLIYVPWKWMTGERFPPDGIATCYKAMDWEWEESMK